MSDWRPRPRAPPCGELHRSDSPTEGKPKMLRPRVAAGVVVIAALVAPGSASAATLSKPAASGYAYRAAAGELNVLQVGHLADGRIELLDSGAVIAREPSASACTVTD